MAVAVAVLSFASQSTSAGTVYTFSAVTNSSATNVATGQAQLSVDVSNGGTIGSVNYVAFTFSNAGPNASSLTQIYFDDGTLLATGSVTDGPGTDFSFNSGGGQVLPGGNAINFDVTSAFTAKPAPPVEPNGVNPGEHVTLTYSLRNRSVRRRHRFCFAGRLNPCSCPATE
jgi:hypothetical protein